MFSGLAILGGMKFIASDFYILISHHIEIFVTIGIFEYKFRVAITDLKKKTLDRAFAILGGKKFIASDFYI